MAGRSDGNVTRNRLLEAASDVFAARGYRDATVAEICKAGRTNVAAINYHFGSKEKLYLEVWKQAWLESEATLSLNLDIVPGDPPEKRLRTFVRNMLYRILVHGPKSRFGRLLLQDMRDPVAAVEPVRRKMVKPMMELLGTLINDIAGTQMSERVRHHCHMSIMHQCLAIGFRGGRKPPILGRGKHFTREEIDYLVDHITAFSVGGIRAIGHPNRGGQ